jgi:hypothetical protein
MRYALEVENGVHLRNGLSPLPVGAIHPVRNWRDIAHLPWYYLKVVDGQVVEKTQAEKDEYENNRVITVEEAWAFLEATDKRVLRYLEQGRDVPQALVAKRAAMRRIIRDAGLDPNDP